MNISAIPRRTWLSDLHSCRYPHNVYSSPLQN